MIGSANEHMWNLVETGEYSDFKITVNGYPEEFKVHRLLLQHFSPVFKAMFENDMIESRSGVINIEDADHVTIKHILRHIYGCKLEETLKLDEILDILIIADKYQIQTLINDCNTYVIKKFIISENAPLLLFNISLFLPSTRYILKRLCFKMIKDKCKELFNNEHALLKNENILIDILNLDEMYNFNLELYVTLESVPFLLSHTDLISFKLKTKCIKIFENNAKEILKKESFLRISRETLLEILNMDKMNIDSEVDLINFVEQWAKVKIKEADDNDSSLKQFLDDKVLPKLRLLTLTKEEFMENICIFIWLTSQERKCILSIIKSGTKTPLPSNFPSYLSKLTIKRSLKYKLSQEKEKLKYKSRSTFFVPSMFTK